MFSTIPQDFMLDLPQLFVDEILCKVLFLRDQEERQASTRTSSAGSEQQRLMTLKKVLSNSDSMHRSSYNAEQASKSISTPIQTCVPTEMSNASDCFQPVYGEGNMDSTAEMKCDSGDDDSMPIIQKYAAEFALCQSEGRLGTPVKRHKKTSLNLSTSRTVKRMRSASRSESRSLSVEGDVPLPQWKRSATARCTKSRTNSSTEINVFGPVTQAAAEGYNNRAESCADPAGTHGGMISFSRTRPRYVLDEQTASNLRNTPSEPGMYSSPAMLGVEHSDSDLHFMDGVFDMDETEGTGYAL